jgi:hypothetical protein
MGLIIKRDNRDKGRPLPLGFHPTPSSAPSPHPPTPHLSCWREARNPPLSYQEVEYGKTDTPDTRCEMGGAVRLEV